LVSEVQEGLERLSEYGIENPSLALAPHELQWDLDILSCMKCHSALKELILLKDALPKQINDAKETYRASKQEEKTDDEEKKIHSTTIKLINIIPSPRLQNKTDLDKLLTTIKNKIQQALKDHDIVELE
jgi:hypothetical protein